MSGKRGRSQYVSRNSYSIKIRNDLMLCQPHSVGQELSNQFLFIVACSELIRTLIFGCHMKIYNQNEINTKRYFGIVTSII